MARKYGDDDADELLVQLEKIARATDEALGLPVKDPKALERMRQAIRDWMQGIRR